LVGPGDVSLSIHESWLIENEKIDFYLEGGTATVMVAERLDTRTDTLDGTKRILVNGSSASNSNFYGQSVNRIQGCLPFIFDRTPRKVLAVCFGTGITFGTLSQYDVERIDAVDISPEVIEAAPAFKQANYDVVHHPRTRIYIDDGRNFLLKSSERYDVITMEPMPPALAGVVDLYTRDFYELCREHLAPGGVMSQWVPLYHLGLDDVKMLYRTFAESFPYALVFHYNFDTFLVGSDRPLSLSAEGFEKRLQSEPLARDLETISLGGSKRMLATFLMDRSAMLRFSGEVPVLTDDLPYVEFTAPKKASMLETPRNYLAVTAFAQPASAYLEAAIDDSELRDELDEVFEINRLRWTRARVRKEELDREREAIYREYERSQMP
jgi:spermidine synthase